VQLFADITADDIQVTAMSCREGKGKVVPVLN
jgi:hypothetical protein